MKSDTQFPLKRISLTKMTLQYNNDGSVVDNLPTPTMFLPNENGHDHRIEVYRVLSKSLLSSSKVKRGWGP